MGQASESRLGGLGRGKRLVLPLQKPMDLTANNLQKFVGEVTTKRVSPQRQNHLELKTQKRSAVPTAALRLKTKKTGLLAEILATDTSAILREGVDSELIESPAEQGPDRVRRNLQARRNGDDTNIHPETYNAELF